jgi:hypothetical protein
VRRCEASFEAYPVCCTLVRYDDQSGAIEVLTCNPFDQTSRTLSLAVVLEAVNQFVKKNAFDLIFKTNRVNAGDIVGTKMYFLEAGVRWCASECVEHAL